jgi:D-serine deaminase-like pyridoxal phosphate-dependent protein
MSTSTTSKGGGTPPPEITLVEPEDATRGVGPIELTVQGTGFDAKSVVQWEGRGLATTYVSGTKLTAVVPPIRLSRIGQAEVTVVDQYGSASDAWYFSVRDDARSMVAAGVRPLSRDQRALQEQIRLIGSRMGRTDDRFKPGGARP